MIVESGTPLLLQDCKAAHGITAEEVVVAKQYPSERGAIEFDHGRGTRRNSKTPERNFIAENVTVYRSERNQSSPSCPGNTARGFFIRSLRRMLNT